MESTVFGHPGEPKMPVQIKGPLTDVEAFDFGLTFENEGDGLRARARITRQ